MMRDRDRLPGRYSRCWIPVASRVTGFYGDGNARLPLHGPALIGASLGETPSPPAWCCWTALRRVLRALRLDGGR